MRGYKVFVILALIHCLYGESASTNAYAATDSRPNVLIVMADDMGYGDLGVHGNPKIKTPNLDRFASESVRLRNFYVSPVCSPTRASLLTGRYNFRTGVVDTYLGRALMRPDEVTLAEMLAVAGYRTGIFGKWHLGDNVPLRPMDQGFERSLVIKGGGIGQPSDPPEGSNYSDPILQANGQSQRFKGYCSDIFAQAAIDFMSEQPDRPFFAYLAFNCPHSPLQAPDAELAVYREMKLDLREFPQLGKSIPATFASPADSVARVYAMITNIDTNIGKVLQALEARGLTDNTIVVFLTDNGPATVRYNAGLRGWKGSVFDGGIHVPCYIRWPGRLPAGRVVDPIAAHIDLVPTLLEACGVSQPAGVHIDGKSLIPLLKGIQNAGWPERTLFFQWHRGDRPEPDRAFAARTQAYKLLRPEPPEGARTRPALQLFDMEHDPLELHDVASVHPAIVARLHAEYMAWFHDVTSTPGVEPVRITLGSPAENPTILTRQDWRGPHAGWEQNDLGFWDVQVAKAGRFEITAHVTPRRFPTKLRLSLGSARAEVSLAPGKSECSVPAVLLTAGPGRLEAWIEGNGNRGGVLDLEVRRVSGD